MNIQDTKLKLSNDYPFIPTHLCFNQTGDKFVTCTADGQIHIYSILSTNYQNNKISKLGFANIFQQNVVCIAWANAQAGGSLAIAGSKGTLVILRIQSYGNKVITQKKFTINIASLDWHPIHKMLLCGTTDGKVLQISSIYREWQISQSIDLPLNSPVFVGWSNFDNNCKFAACQSVLYEITKSTQKKIKSNEQSIIKQLYKLHQNQPIKKMLTKTQGSPALLDIILLSPKKVHIFQYSNSPTKLQLIQQIQLIKNIQTISWSYYQNQFACYPQPKLFDSNKSQLLQSNNRNPPLVFKRKVNGIWAEVK